MSPIAKVIQSILRQRHGAPYANEKAEEIKNKKPSEVLQWACSHLDPKNQQALMAALGLPPDCACILRRAFDAAERIQAKVAA